MKIPSTPKEKIPMDTESLAVSRSRELADLIQHFASKQPIEEFYTWLNEINSLSEDFSNNKKVQEATVRALKSAIRMFGERKAFADMLFVLDELQVLQKRYPESDSYKEDLGEAFSIVIYHLRGSWDTEGTSFLLKKLRDLIRDNSDNILLKIHYAKSYSNAINRFCSDRHNFTCDKLLFEIRMFANKNRENEDVQYEFAQALTSVIGTFARENRTEELEHILEELRRIAGRFSESEKIQLLLTRGTILSSLVSNRNE
jgi:hypothetical protein